MPLTKDWAGDAQYARQDLKVLDSLWVPQPTKEAVDSSQPEREDIRREHLKDKRQKSGVFWVISCAIPFPSQYLASIFLYLTL